ncbi:MAG: hypothetical protein ACTSRG_26140, partial [Candidatus Helarchaeota archaeon]
MMDKLEKEIENITKKRKDLHEDFIGYIPEDRIINWILAVKEFLMEIQELVTLIKKDMIKPNLRISVEVRLILIFLRATFRIITTQLETVLLNDKNSRLFEFLKLFSEHIYISYSEWSNRR